MKVINKTTNEILTATYAANRLGNLRMWVNGVFYNDKQFSKKFNQIDPTENYVKVDGQWKPINS